jgi:acyl-coenzyme A synthetase/AMP-(fatty) acid ligase
LNNVNLTALTSRSPSEVIAYRADGPITVARFLAEVKWLAPRLPPRTNVINLATDRYRFLLGFCASIVAGQCTLMPPNRLSATLDQLVADYPDSYRLENDEPLFGESACLVFEGCETVPDIPAKQLCAIAFTSGSTGQPKPNLKYWKTLVTGTLGNAALLQLGCDDRMNLVATVPSQHMWGMETAILLPLFAKVAASYRTPFFPQDIADALADISPPRALVSSPVHLDALIRSGVALPALKRILCATAPMSTAQAVKLEDEYATRVQEVFGCTESGIIAMRETARESLWRVAETLRLEPGKNGFVVLGEHLPGPVLLPDVIELHGLYHFRWIGRQQDMVKIAGKRESLGDLNLRLLAIDGIDDGVIFSPGDDSQRLAALVVADDLSPAQIRQVLGQHVDPVFLPRPIYLVDRLPRQETGKLARAAILDIFTQMQSTQPHPHDSVEECG